MLTTTLPPSPSAAARGRGSCGPRDVHTRWKGKSTQNVEPQAFLVPGEMQPEWFPSLETDKPL